MSILKRRRITHDDELTVVEHLDELRGRLIVCALTFAVALGICFWQNHRLLHIVNHPLHGRRPITLGVAEPFTTTLTVAAYAAILLSLPIILYHAYAYVMPAFTPQERRVALPLLLMIPFLFLGGVAFGYFVVLPAALHFLLHFNSHQFNLQIRARDYYGFVGMTMLACGLVFQVPVGVLALTRLGVVTPQKLRKNRRYAIVVCAVIAAALPGVDPLSMLLEMIPLIVLYELSILLASVFGRPAVDPADRLASAEGS
jgi:sec-independent protein translocase protein TatC